MNLKDMAIIFLIFSFSCEFVASYSKFFQNRKA